MWVGAFLPLGIQDLGAAGKKPKCMPRSVHASGDGSCSPSTTFIETSVLEAWLASSICSAPQLPGFSLYQSDTLLSKSTCHLTVWPYL